MTPSAASLSERPRSPASGPAIDHAWTPGPARPSLAHGAVHVWLADLSAVSAEALGALSRPERRRAERFARARDGLLWARSRGVLRALLGSYLDAEPAAIELRIARNGKPALAPTHAGARLAFNLSHSGPLALYALTSGAPVGVDVQSSPARRIDAAAIARRAFGSEEARRLARLDPERRMQLFLRAWTRHEAALKCRGWGVYGGVPAAHSNAAERGASAALWVAELNLGDVLAAAIALPSAPAELRCWSWRRRREASGGGVDDACA